MKAETVTDGTFVNVKMDQEKKVENQTKLLELQFI